MAKLRQLFDFQKIAENQELSGLIDETHKRYDKATKLDDEYLELAVAGKMEILESEGSMFDTVTMNCSHCGWANVVSLYCDSFKCVKCGNTTQIYG